MDIRNSRFLFYARNEDFLADKPIIQADNPNNPIVFIADTKTIWTHNTEFNASNVTGISQEDLNNELNDVKLDYEAAIENLRQNISNQLSRLAQLAAEDLLDTKDKILELKDNIDNFDLSGYDDYWEKQLAAFVKTTDALGLIDERFTTYREEIDAQLGLIDEKFDLYDLSNESGTFYRRLIELITGTVSESIRYDDINESISTEVGREMDAVKGMLEEYVKRTDFTDGEGHYVNWFADLVLGAGNIEAIVSRLDRVDGDIDKIRTILGWLGIKIDDNGTISWELGASNGDAQSYIMGVVKDNSSELTLSANLINIDGTTTLAGKLLIISNQIELINSDPLWGDITTIKNTGITIEGDDGRILLVKDQNNFSGLRHLYRNSPGFVDGTFELNTNGSGYLGKKQLGETHHPIEWKSDGTVYINASNLHSKDGDLIDESLIGSYTIHIYCVVPEKINGIAYTPNLPSSTQTFDSSGYIYVQDSILNGYVRWQRNDSTKFREGYCVWVAMRLVDRNGKYIQGKSWQGPILWSGPQGAAGKDSDGTMYIFVHSKSTPVAVQTPYEGTYEEAYEREWYTLYQNTNDPYSTVPPLPDSSSDLKYWCKNASDIDATLSETYPYVYWSCSTTANKNDNDEVIFTNFTKPAIWAKWGVDGKDGGGVEYIFFLGTPNTIFEDDANPQTWDNDQDFQTLGYIKTNSGWTQDPQSLTALGMANWVSIRRQNNEGVWQQYSKPTIWAYYAENAISSAYTMAFDNDNLVVSVDEYGHIVGKDSSNNYITYTNIAQMQVWDVDGTSIPSSYKFTSTGNTSGKYFELSKGEAYVAAARPQSNDWKELSTGEYDSNGEWDDDNGNVDWGLNSGSLVKVLIHNHDQWVEGGAIYLSAYAEPQDIKNKHIYIPITVTIYETDGTSATAIYSRNVMLTVFGVYTGVSGQSLDLKTNCSVVKRDKNSVTTPARIEPYLLITTGTVASGQSILIIYPSNDLNYVFQYKWDGGSFLPLSSNSGIDVQDSNANFPITIRVSLNGTVIDSEEIPLVQDGSDGSVGATGQASLKSFIFTRTTETPIAPDDLRINALLEQNESREGSAGSYNTPVPQGDYNIVYTIDENYIITLQQGLYWSDGIPTGDAPLWESTRIFTSDGLAPQQANWSTPAKVTDSNGSDIEFSFNDPYVQLDDDLYDYLDRNTPENKEARNDLGWYDPSEDTLPQDKTWSDMIWRAERRVKDFVYQGDWVYTRVKGEKGSPGDAIYMHLDNLVDIITVDANNRTTYDVIVSTPVAIYDQGQIVSFTNLSATSLFDTFDPKVYDSLRNDYVSIDPTYYFDDKVNIYWIIPEGTLLSGSTKATITATHDSKTYSAIFNINTIQSGVAPDNPNIYQLSLNRNTILFKKQYNINTLQVEYIPITELNSVEIQIKKTGGEADENGVNTTTYFNRKNGFSIKWGYTGEADYDIQLIGEYEQLDLNPRSWRSITADFGESETGPLTLSIENPSDIVEDGELIHREIWVQLIYSDNVIDEQTIRIDSTARDGIDGANGTDGIDGSSVRLDLDNDIDSIACEYKTVTINGSESQHPVVLYDQTIVTRLRLYSGSRIVPFAEYSWQINSAPSVSVYRGGNQINISSTISNVGSDVDNQYRLFTYTFKKGDILVLDKNNLTYQVSYQDTTYYTTFKINVIYQLVKYLLSPNPNCIVFSPENNSEVKTISCGYTTTDGVLYLRHSLDQSNIIHIGEKNYTIYYRYEYHNGTYTIFLQYNGSNITIPNTYTQSNRYSSILFALSEAGLNKTNILEASVWVMDRVVDLESVPILYNGLAGDASESIDIQEIAYYYKITNTSTAPDYPSSLEYASDYGWQVYEISDSQSSMQLNPTIENPYLWNFSVVGYNDGLVRYSPIVLVKTYFYGVLPNLLKGSAFDSGEIDRYYAISAEEGAYEIDKEGIAATDIVSITTDYDVISELYNDTWYTLSFELRGNGYVLVSISNNIYDGGSLVVDGSSSTNEYSTDILRKRIRNNSSLYEVHTITWKTRHTAWTANDGLQIQFVVDPDQNETIYIRRPKLENGAMYTGWQDNFGEINLIASKNPIYYPAGIYDSDTTYDNTNDQIPYVYYDLAYYWLNSSTIDNCTRSVPGSQNSEWVEMHMMTPIMTNAVIADYAKLNSAIFANNYMFSQHGVIGSAFSDHYLDFHPWDTTTLSTFTPNFHINFETGAVYAGDITADALKFKIKSKDEPGKNYICVSNVRYYLCDSLKRSTPYYYMFTPMYYTGSEGLYANAISVIYCTVELYRQGLLIKRGFLEGVPCPPSSDVEVRTYTTTVTINGEEKQITHYRLYDDIISAVKQKYGNDVYSDDDLVLVQLPEVMWYTSVTDGFGNVNPLRGDIAALNNTSYQHHSFGYPICVPSGIVGTLYRYGDVTPLTKYEKDTSEALGWITQDANPTDPAWVQYYDSVTPGWRTNNVANGSRPIPEIIE